ncbi:MAG: DUF4342 domain-containing protein [Dethiobacter sp.]|jgi:hypothetical protein|nr:DUF4342 domain-containing protein [Dethiobacter sp.]
MEDSLEKIELIRDRTGLSYAQARELLEESGGDVIEALVTMEEEGVDGESGVGMISREIISPVKKVFRQSNRTRIKVKNRDGTLLEIPITVGLAGALLAPRMTALGTMVLLMAQYSLESHQSEAAETDWEN